MATTSPLNKRTAIQVYQDVDAIKDYRIDWTEYLTELNTGDTLAASTWAVYDTKRLPVSGKLDLTNPAPSFTPESTTVWVDPTGGLAGEKYYATNHIVTAGGREDDQSILIILGEI